MLDNVRQTTRGRWVAAIAGLAFAAVGILLGSGPYLDRRAFEKAGYCTASTAGDDCIARTRMTVVSKSTYTTNDPDPNWPPPQPPQPPPQPPPIPGPFRIAPASLPMSQTTHYKLTVRTEDGKRHTFNVDYHMYDSAKPGTTGVAEVWHGHIKRLRIGANQEEKWSYWSLGSAWVLAWIGVMLLVAWAVPLRDVPVWVVIGGWWLGVLTFGVTHGWASAIWMIPVIFGGAILLLRVWATIADARWRARRAVGGWTQPFS
jgi:hypothetical protein